MSNPKSYTDHLGNKFNSISEMCEYWNINKDTYRHRIQYGWSLENALTKHVTQNKRKCIDHLGNEIESMTEMCKYWNIDRRIFKKRIKRNWSIKDALTKNKSTTLNKKCIDHLSNEFNSVEEMCKYYKISVYQYYNRLKHNYCDLEILSILPIIYSGIQNGTQITKNLKLIEKQYDRKSKLIVYYICENQNGLRDIYTREELIKLIAKEKGLIVTYNLIKNYKTEPKRQRKEQDYAKNIAKNT